MRSHEVGVNLSPEKQGMQPEHEATGDNLVIGVECLKALARQLPAADQTALPPGIKRIFKEREEAAASAAYGFQSRF